MVAIGLTPFFPIRAWAEQGLQDPFRNTVFDWLIPTKHGILMNTFDVQGGEICVV